MTVRLMVEQMNPSGIDANESTIHRSSGPLRQISARRYGLAILSVGVALGASLLLDHFHFRVPSALLLLFAVAISSWYAGAGPAVLAAILSTISFYWYFVEPVHTIYISRSQIPYFVIFTAFAALLSRFGTFRQRAEADFRRTHDQLEVERPKLGSRTIALLYFAFSSCWILFTDRLVHGLGLSNAYLLKVSEAKGILFISLSTLLMYVLVEKALRERHSVATAYWQLVETAQEGVWSVDAEGKTVFANENMAAILGTSPGEMIGKSILPFVPQEKKDELLSHLLQGEQGLQEHYEFPFLRADGAQVWTLLRVSPVLRDGQHSGCLALVSDITKRKHAEEALRRLNRELRAISNCNQALLRATDEQSLLEEICRIVCEEAGYRMAWVGYAERDEANSVRPVAWTGAEEGYLSSAGISWADTESGRGPTGEAIRSGKSCCVQDFATDPRMVPWRESLLQHGFRSGIALPLKDENANAFGSLTIHSAQPDTFGPEEIRLLEELAGDLAFGIVTLRSGAARKQAEQALRRSEAYLAEAERINHTGTWAWTSSEIQYWSQECYRIMGLDPAEGVPSLERFLKRIHPDDLPRLRERLLTVAREKTNYEDEYRIVRPNGEVRDLHIIGHPVFDSAGNLLEYIGTTADVTERKRAEEALRRSEAYLAEAQRLTHTGSWATDAVPEPLYWSEELFRLYGLNSQDGLPTHGQAVQRVHPEDRDQYVQAFHRVIHQKVDSEVEFRTVLPDGTVKHLHGIGHPVLNANGEVVEVVGTTADITERKRAEEALHESETRFRTFVDHAGDALFVQDLEQRTIVDVNRQACESLGYTRQELIGKTAVAFHLDADRAEMEAAAERAAAGETVFDRHSHRRKDGTVFLVEANTSSFCYGGRRFLLHVSRDITDRLRAEEAIRQSEKQLRDVIEGIPAIASTIRLDGSVEFINKRWQEYTGMSTEESVGPGWQSAGHPQDMGHYLEKRRAALASGHPFEDEARIRSRDGKYRWFLLRGAPLRDARGNIVKWYTTAIDIDDRKLAEEVRLEERVRERTRIARELHDTLLQSFHGTLFHFQAASNLLPTRTAKAKRMLDSAIDMAEQAITEGRDAIQGLRSPEVEINDLAVAIRTFGESYAADRGDEGSPAFQVELVGVARELDPNFAREVYRIAIEALRNSFQHAEARHIKVEIHHEEKEFRVFVRDDGKGIDSKSLGAEGVKGHYGLHGMRERAKLIGSEIMIRSEVGGGTEVELRAAAITAYAACVASS